MGVGGGVHGAYYGVDQSSYRIQSKVASETSRKTTSGDFRDSPLKSTGGSGDIQKISKNRIFNNI